MSIKETTCPRCGSEAKIYNGAMVACCNPDRDACFLTEGIPLGDWNSLRFAPSPEPLPRYSLELHGLYPSPDGPYTKHEPWMEGK